MRKLHRLVAVSVAVAAGAPALVAQNLDPERLPVPDPEPGAQLGFAVDVSGARVVAGAPVDDGAESNSGAAYVWIETASGWELETKLFPADAQASDWFGTSVAIDGERLVVGAAGCDDVALNHGAVYVFDRVGSSWVESAKLVGSDPGPNDRFSNSVAVEGDTVLVGAPYHVTNNVAGGSAFVFVRQPSGWVQSAKLTASDAADDAYFGTAVALSGDRALVGAPRDDEIQTDAGAGYVFTRNGSAWSQTQKLVALDGGVSAELGQAVGLDGERLVLAAPFDEPPSVGGNDRGAAYFFERQTGSWNQVAKVVSADSAALDYFGYSAALDEDLAIFGATGTSDGGNNTGSAYVVRRTPIGWLEVEELHAPDAAENEMLGYAVAVDGSLLVAATRLADGVGAAYVARRALAGYPPQVSVSGGTTHVLSLETGPAYAGLPYVVLGSLTGTAPGYPLDGQLLPLAVDSYLLHTLTSPNAPPLAGSLGQLDDVGRASASFALPPGTGAALVGVEANHAFVALELLPGLLRVALISNAVPIQLVP